MNLEGLDFLKENIMLLLPIIVLYYGFVIYCVVDLFKTDQPVKGNNKILWLLVILFVNLFGPVIYLLVGKGE